MRPALLPALLLVGAEVTNPVPRRRPHRRCFGLSSQTDRSAFSPSHSRMIFTGSTKGGQSPRATATGSQSAGRFSALSVCGVTSTCVMSILRVALALAEPGEGLVPVSLLGVEHTQVEEWSRNRRLDIERMLVCRDRAVPVFQVLVGEGEIAPSASIVRFVCGYLFQDLRRALTVVSLQACDARGQCRFGGRGLGLRGTSDSNDKGYNKTILSL